MNQNVHIGVKFITEPQNREAWRAGVPPRAPPLDSQKDLKPPPLQENKRFWQYCGSGCPGSLGPQTGAIYSRGKWGG